MSPFSDLQLCPRGDVHVTCAHVTFPMRQLCYSLTIARGRTAGFGKGGQPGPIINAESPGTMRSGRSTTAVTFNSQSGFEPSVGFPASLDPNVVVICTTLVAITLIVALVVLSVCCRRVSTQTAKLKIVILVSQKYKVVTPDKVSNVNKMIEQHLPPGAVLLGAMPNRADDGWTICCHSRIDSTSTQAR